MLQIKQCFVLQTRINICEIYFQYFVSMLYGIYNLENY